MSENQSVLQERLQQLLTRKKSRKYYAHKLGISEENVRELMEHIRRGEEAIADLPELSNYITELENTIIKFEEDVKKGTGEVTAKVRDEIKTLEELISKCKIDTDLWNIERYVQNYWGNSDQPHWQVKAFLTKKTPAENFQKNFLDFLNHYIPLPGRVSEPIGPILGPYNKACLIINKQDEHLNKFDILGNNSIKDRFNNTYKKIETILIGSCLTSNVEEIVYILGSDEFNSEWTGCTTRGTPQQNIMPYQEAFTNICNYELQVIELLKKYCVNLKVIYVPGNHDEYVGWHMINWLQAYYKDATDIQFDCSPRYRKYMRFGKSAIMFNHGDAIKPAKLSNMFPIEFKEEWSKAENFYIFTGDKHHEVSLDFTGIKFYQLPALSGSKSLWDDKQGHTCSKPELTAFLIEEEAGMTNIYKQPL